MSAFFKSKFCFFTYFLLVFIVTTATFLGVVATDQKTSAADSYNSECGNSSGSNGSKGVSSTGTDSTSSCSTGSCTAGSTGNCYDGKHNPGGDATCPNRCGDGPGGSFGYKAQGGNYFAGCSVDSTSSWTIWSNNGSPAWVSNCAPTYKSDATSACSCKTCGTCTDEKCGCNEYDEDDATVCIDPEECTDCDICGCDEYNSCRDSSHGVDYYTVTKSNCTVYSSSRTCTQNNYKQSNLTAESNVDVGSYRDIPQPTDNGTCFWDAPPFTAGDAPRFGQYSSCEQNNPGRCADGPNGCGQNMHANIPVYHAVDSCKIARDGKYQCGGSTACGEDKCGIDYIKSPGPYWSVNSGGRATGGNKPNGCDPATGQLTTGVVGALSSNCTAYSMADIQGKRDVADKVCGLTGTKKSANYEIFCRCDQFDICAGKSGGNQGLQDLQAWPLKLKIYKLYLEKYIGTPNNNSYGIDLLNTPEKHQLVVEFRPADYYTQSEANKREVEKDTLYTRLIEVCPYNLLTGGVVGKCVLKRVDGDINRIQEAIKITLNVGPESQGPWTIKYRAMNDVCHRTYGDAGPDKTGDIKEINDGAYKETCSNCGCETGKFSGMQPRGNHTSFPDPDGAPEYCPTSVDESRFQTYSASNSLSRGHDITKASVPKDISNPRVGSAVRVRTYGIGYAQTDYTVDNQNTRKFVTN